MKALPYFVSFTIFVTVIVGLKLGGAWLLLTPGYIFVLLPILDAIGGLDHDNPEEVSPKINRDFWHDLSLWLWVPAQVGGMLYGLVTEAAGGFSALEFV
ncbi:MAG: hypothetical protein JKY37_31940, partial [Nannocystaceae bacterium]|nr:hypothetical protein [Nannocystaceae bacterium]